MNERLAKLGKLARTTKDDAERSRLLRQMTGLARWALEKPKLAEYPATGR